MTGLVVMFAVVFVLVLAGMCALQVARMLGPLELPDSPSFPHRMRPHHHAKLASSEADQAAVPEDFSERP